MGMMYPAARLRVTHQEPMHPLDKGSRYKLTRGVTLSNIVKISNEVYDASSEILDLNNTKNVS